MIAKSGTVRRIGILMKVGGNDKVRLALILYARHPCLCIGLVIEVNPLEILAAGSGAPDLMVERFGAVALLKNQILYNNYCLICLPSSF